MRHFLQRKPIGLGLGEIVRAGAALLVLAACTSVARADSAYIQQAAGGNGGNIPQFNGGPQYSRGNWTPPPSYKPSYETAVPTRLNSNVAGSLTIGAHNLVSQFQTGLNDTSNVSILGGYHDNVGVFQGSNDQSNIALLNMQNVGFDVIEPKGAAPLNMLLARVPHVGIVAIIGR